MGKVTVLVPIYNVEEYVEGCLESLLNQTLADIKILAIDDGSPDNSKEIVKKIAAKDSRVELIEKENGGYGSVLELGIKKTNSEFLLICDPDDWLAPKALEVLYDEAIRKNLDLVVGDKFNVYENGSNQEYIKTFKPELKIVPNQVYEGKNLGKFNFGLVSPHAKLFKKDIVKNISFPYHVSYTDLVLYIIGLTKAKRVEYINQPLAYYRIERPGNTKTDVRASIIEDYLIGWNSILNQLSYEDRKNPLLLYRLYYQLRYVLVEYRRVKNQPEADKYFDKVVESFDKLLPYKTLIFEASKENSFRKKIVNHLLFNRSTRKAMAKLIVSEKNS